MRTKTRADRIVTNVLREVAAELGVPYLRHIADKPFTRGSRFQLTAKDYGKTARERLPLYEQVCRVNGPNVYWQTVYPGNKFAKKRRADSSWVLDNAKILRR